MKNSCCVTHRRLVMMMEPPPQMLPGLLMHLIQGLQCEFMLYHS